MEILVGFGIGPRTESIIRYYWENLSMLERVGQYYRTPFKVHWGVTHPPLPPLPIIFKMVVDTVIFHWVTLISGEEVGPDGFGWAIQWLAVLFYADNGLLPSHMPACLQEVIIFLTGMFDMVSLQTNV